MDAININNIDLSAHRFPPKSIHHICSTMELTINNSLETYDEDNINLEEEHFAIMLNHYNLRSNPNFEEDVYVDDRFLAIEEEEEEEEAINPLASGGNNNNISGVNPPVGRDPPTGPPTDQPPTPPSTPPDPPTAADHRKKPRKGKHLTLLKLIQDRSD